eukprot:s475_g38.t1
MGTGRSALHIESPKQPGYVCIRFASARCSELTTECSRLLSVVGSLSQQIEADAEELSRKTLDLEAEQREKSDLEQRHGASWTAHDSLKEENAQLTRKLEELRTFSTTLRLRYDFENEQAARADLEQKLEEAGRRGNSSKLSDSEAQRRGSDCRRTTPVRETRDQIAATFTTCPGTVRALGSRLQGTDRDCLHCIDRAWVAGQWAKAVLEERERVHSPNRTPPLDLRSRFYAVARCNGLSRPTIFKSSTSYWRHIGSLEGSLSVSQAFPSETEASVYLRSAGFAEEEIHVLP